MKKVLGLDISSATIGWGLVSNEGELELLAYGHIKPTSNKKANGDLSVRLSDAYNKVKTVIETYNPDEVAVEDYAKRFQVGRSSADTIIKLATFNETVALAVYHTLGTSVHRYTVSRLRSLVGKHYVENGLVSKDDAYTFVSEYFKNFETKITSKGNIKKECGDEADAILVCVGHILDQQLR